LLRLLFGRVRDDDSADLLFAFLKAVNNDAVVQRSDVHTLFSAPWLKSGAFPNHRRE
jgi:hypothetical protein